MQGRNSYSDADGTHYGIAIHNTSNDASDEDEASYAKRRTDGVSSHLYTDKDSVTQSLSLTARAGHAGSSTGNNNSLAVEITGGNGKTRAWWLANVAWDKLGKALAWVIDNDPDYRGFQVRRASVSEMKSNPRVKAFYGHDDMRRAWGGTTHTDPGGNFPWDKLFSSVNKYRSGGTGGGGGWDEMATKAEVQAAVVAAIEQTREFQHSGPRSRLKDTKVWPPNGWGDLSTREMLEYVFEFSQSKELKAAWLETAANVKVLSGKDFVNEGEIIEGVLGGLGRGDLSDAEIADILRRGLGDRTAAVAAILSQPAG